MGTLPPLHSSLLFKENSGPPLATGRPVVEKMVTTGWEWGGGVEPGGSDDGKSNTFGLFAFRVRVSGRTA